MTIAPAIVRRAVVLTLAAVTILFASHEGSAQHEENLVELEAFIAEETLAINSNSLIPADRSIDGVIFRGTSIMDLPRSVSVISPEAMSQYALTNVNELAQVVSGASVINYFGVPGIPTTRGLFTGIYFNGMQRVWNRNGYPTSFGSLEAMEYVKGPAPSNYSASSPGGFVNFIPKSPFFDKIRGQTEVSIGKYQNYRAQFDMGGPIILGNRPAAYRLSATFQDAGSYYTGAEDDYLSLYASIKMRLSERWSIFLGGEFYLHRSNEIPGWNRVTQDLIDHGDYIIGSPAADLTGDSITLGSGSNTLTFVNETPGFVNRAALETATPFGGSRGVFGGSFLARSGFLDAGFRIENFSEDTLAFYQALGGIANPGPGITTARVDGSQILTSPNDFANADTYLFFFDTTFAASDDLTITNKLFVDAYAREKTSDYGYGEFGENFTIENKIVVDHALGGSSRLTYGVSVRYEDALAKTEFTVEPFGRRDILSTPDPNDTLKSGGQRDANGRTFWDPFGSWDTQMWTFGAFLNGRIELNDRFSLLASGRINHATWDRAVPFDLASDFNSGEKPGGGTTYSNWSLSSSFKLNEYLTAYYTYQLGTAFQGYYVSGNVSNGDTNFQVASLHETGLRALLAGGNLYAGISFYYQDLVDFDDRGGEAFAQRGSGVEFDLSYKINSRIHLNLSAAWQEHYYRRSTLPSGFVALTPEEIVAYGGLFYADFGGRPNPGGPRFGIPAWSANILLKYETPKGFGISGGPTLVDSVFGNPEKSLTLPGYTTINGNIFYRGERWEVMVTGKNITSTDYFHPLDAFAANAIILKEPPAQVAVKVTYKF